MPSFTRSGRPCFSFASRPPSGRTCTACRVGMNASTRGESSNTVRRRMNRRRCASEPTYVTRELAHLSDEALVALAARSEQTALAELYDRYGRAAYGLALRILRDEALAEDAVQEAFLALWRTASRFVPERGKASTWILTLVHRRAVDLVRREERRRADPLDEAHEPAPARSARRRAGVAAPPARARAGGAPAAPRPAARGARARVLRRLHAVRARRAARPAHRYDQEQDVRRPRAPARAAR